MLIIGSFFVLLSCINKVDFVWFFFKFYLVDLFGLIFLRYLLKKYFKFFFYVDFLIEGILFKNWNSSYFIISIRWYLCMVFCIFYNYVILKGEFKLEEGNFVIILILVWSNVYIF